MKRVLVCGFTENYGGMESYIMGIYRHIDRELLQFDFVNVLNKKIAYEDEIRELGGQVHYVPRKKNGIIQHYKKIKEIFKNNEYEAVYYQCNRKIISLDMFKYAKKNGVPYRIIHSHNSTQINVSKLDAIRQSFSEKNMDKYVNKFFACSEEAGKWMFDNREFTVIKNSVNVDKFRFNPQLREKFRNKYNTGDKLIIGTVGRLEEQKNPLYIIEIVRELKNTLNDDFLFWHVGEGAYKETMLERINKYNLDDIYTFFDRETPVYEIMNAMDVFILPSKHEGFPIVLVEAQATGLPCVISDNITMSCDLTGKISYISLDEDYNVWTKKIVEMSEPERTDGSMQICEKGYDIESVALEIQEFFVK